MLNALLEFDEFLFGLINGQWHLSFLDSLMPYWRDKYSWIPLYLLLLGYGIFTYKKQSVFWILALLLTVGIADTTSSQFIKKSVERLRPCNNPALEKEVRELVQCGSGYSFTSSHATNHFAVAAFLVFTLFRRNKLWANLLWFWAASISYGQIYVGLHYPLDVLVGGLIGILIGALIAHFYKSVFEKHLEQA